MSAKNLIVKNTAYIAIFISFLLLVVIGCSSKKEIPTPTVSPTATATEVVPEPTPTQVAQMSPSTRAEQILALAEDRESYYDKDFVYLDIQNFQVEDLTICATAFRGLMYRNGEPAFFDAWGLATFMGDNHEYVIVPQPLVPLDPKDLPQELASTMSDMNIFMILMNKDGSNNTLDEPTVLPDFRVVVFDANDDPNRGKILASVPSSCAEIVIGDSSLLERFDVLIAVGLAGEMATLTKENVALISARVKSISSESHGFYFDGTILKQDMGALVFALHLGKPELVGIVTGANWSLGYETQNFATNFDEIVDEIEKLKTPE